MDIQRARLHVMDVQLRTVSPAELYEVIVGASSQDFTQVQASSQRLKQLLDMPGAYNTLHEIAVRRDIPLPVRQQAIIQFKNVALSHWKSRRLMTDEQRELIRQRCLSFIDEDDDTIAECNEVVVAKLARTDYPNLWPTLIDDLVGIIDSNLRERYSSGNEDPINALKIRRSLKLLNVILKEFSTVKLPNGMKAMAQIVTRLRPLLYDYYARMSTVFSAGGITPENISSDRISGDISLSHLVYKCLVKIGIWLWNKLGRFTEEEFRLNFDWIEELSRNSLNQLRSLVALRKSILTSIGPLDSSGRESTRRTIVTLTKHLRVFGKFFRRLQQLSAERFASLPFFNDLILFYWSEIVDSIKYSHNLVSDSDEALFPVRFLVQGLVLFKDSLSQWVPTKRNGESNKNVLSKDFVENAVQLLVSRFMLLRPDDLENWLADPEDWFVLEDREGDQWEYEIRPCSERVLAQLCNQFPEFVVPLLHNTFQQVASTFPVNIDNLLQKEALYCAIGCCARWLKEVIDFEAALQNIFAVETHEANPNYTIIKRRVAWLIGKWVSEDCCLPNHPKIWGILTYLISPDLETVVKLTATGALRDCVDSIGFEPNSFAPFLTPTIPQLIRLMADAETLESKRKVDGCLNVVIEQSGELILPYIPLIVVPIPQLWETAGKDLLFKASLLVTVTNLVKASKEQSASLSNLVVALVKDSLAPENIVQLDADGINLWLAALHNSPGIETSDLANLRELFPQAVHLLSTNLDLLGSITGVMESYFLLDAVGILQTQSFNLFGAYLNAFSNKVSEINAKELLRSLGLLVQLAPSQFWGEAMHTSGIFSHLLKTLLAEETDTLVLTEHIYLFSRILLSDSSVFLKLMSGSAASLGQPETTLFDLLMGVWWEKFDNMSEPRQRKLTALGTAVLVSTTRPEVLGKLSTDIFNLWLDVFGELKEAQERQGLESATSSSDNLIRFWDLDEPQASYYKQTEGTPEYSRRKAMFERDPVKTVPLISFVRTKLREAETACGITQFQNYTRETDPAVWKQIHDFLSSC